MAAEKREIQLDLLAKAKTKQATDEAARDIGKVGTAADKAGKQTEEFGKKTTVSGDKAEDLGSSSQRAAKGIQALDTDISKVNQNLAFLHEAFAQAQDAAERLDISKGIRKSEGELRRLTKSKSFLQGMLGDPEVEAKSFMRRLGGALDSGGAGIATAAGSKAGLVIGGTIGAAAAPVLMSALGSAVSAGVGGAVLGAGIALAAKDPQIQVAATGVGKRFATGVQREATEAFKGPVLESLKMLDGSGQRVTQNLGRAFDALADDVVPLTASLARSAERVTEAVANVAEDSGPALKTLGQSVELLSDGFGDFLETVADGSPEAASNLLLVAGATADVARYSGLVISTAGEMANNPWLTGPLLPILRDHYSDAAREQGKLVQGADGSAFRDMSEGATELTESLQKTEDAIQDVLDANRSLYGSNTDVAGAIADTNEEIRKNGKGLSLATEKGRENREALHRLAGTLSANYDAYVKVNGAGDRAQEVLGRNRDAFIRAAEAAGYSKRKATELANALLGIPKRVTPTIYVSGTASSMDKLETLRRKLATIKDRTVYVRVATVEGRKLKVEDQLNRSSYRERGGPVSKGKAYVVGEKRAEVFVPDRDGKIIPSIEQYHRQGGQAHAAVSTATPQVVRHILDVRVGGHASNAMKAFVQELFRETTLGYGN